ncbi:MAG: DUF4838 domain-containing protein [Lentimicrobium sp.]
MKKFLVLFCLLPAMLPGRAFAQQQLITDGLRSYYSIAVAETADSLTLLAAGILQESIFRMTGCRLQIQNQPVKKLKSFFIGCNWLKGKPVYTDLKSLTGEGFYLYSDKDDYYLAGNQPTGDIYAVYKLLETCGFLQFSATEAFYPQTDKLVLEEIRQGFQPDFTFRHPHFPDKNNPAYYLPGRTHLMDDWGLFVHTFQKLCPPGIYFDQHPEYFSLVNGRRIRDGQLCLSNPEVISLLTENLRQEIAKNPECKYWSVSQNDCINYCECEHCRELYDKYGSISGAYIFMANQIARQFPDKQISTLAYQFTRSAPTNILPDSNVNIMFCSIECNRSQPLETDIRSRGFVQDMQDWAALTGNIFMWDYVVQFKTYTCPFPNFSVLQPNIQFYQKNGVPMMFQQGSGSSWSDFCEYKQSLIAHLLWDPHLDEPVFRQKFFSAFYGAASTPMLEYFSRVQQEMDAMAEQRNLDIYGYPVLYASWFLKPSLLIEYKTQMDKAEALVSDDSTRLNRVVRQRCSVDFAYLDVALNLNDQDLSFYQIKQGKKEINPAMTGLLDRFVENCNKTGILTIDENGYTPAQYRAQAMNIASMAIKPNKAAGKTITSLTPYSPLYEVGGEKALTDGLFGGQHFRLNWLGYHENDMELLVDFGNPEKFSKVETNFFLDLVSWIFLPLEVRMEVSDDGLAFRQLLRQAIPEQERNHGQRPVHFTFDFPETTARFLKLTATSLKTCPDWHRGAGQPAWIFVDELVVD